MKEELIIATRKSPLAMAQTKMVAEHFQALGLAESVSILPMETSGDQRRDWSLQKEGGKGLFTKELEMALILGNADIAVHSGKDLPTEMPKPLAIAGFMERADARDVLVLRESCNEPKQIATGSPRRRAQAKAIYPSAVWSEIRGNVDTRLNKVAKGVCDATFLAAAGLHRLGITEWKGVQLRPLSVETMVPAVGQAAIAIQCRAEEVDLYRPHLHEVTRQAVELERAFLQKLGGGCHSAFAGYYDGEIFHAFHEDTGRSQVAINAGNWQDRYAILDSFVESLLEAGDEDSE